VLHNDVFAVGVVVTLDLVLVAVVCDDNKKISFLLGLDL
jgi:hypothetical protein